jgi:hypothetical protein
MYGCRFCGSPLQTTFVDLGTSPLCQSHLEPDDLNKAEQFFPLQVFICDKCLLIQLPEHVHPETIFTEYAYFSSYADTFVDHMKAYADMIVGRFGLDHTSQVIEIASNDGYLLQFFLPKGIPVIGIEPAANVARAAVDKGVSTIVRFFNPTLAQELVTSHKSADLLIANNVLPHVPDLNGFVDALQICLKPKGVITLEFQYLVTMMQGNQFDTIYHEHFSYFSLTTARNILAAHNLTVFDVEEISTHGGSLRLYVRHAADDSKPITPRISHLLAREEADGLNSLSTYFSFPERVKTAKRNILDFLISAKRAGKSIAGYGAPGKANTLLNYCGIRTDFLDYTVDRNPYKQGKFMPGTRIPIFHPDKVSETKPDYVIILPWNLKSEIIEQLSFIRDWGGQFVILIPDVQIYS